MKVIGILPARWASTRLPGKVLMNIAGKPLVQHTWQRVKLCRELSRVIIACDEEHVFEAVKAFGAEAMMTKKEHASGSDRVAEVARQYSADIIVNIQADEPFVDPHLIDAMVVALSEDKKCVMSTPIQPCSSLEEIHNPNIVKVVIDQNQEALYFSRSMIPFQRDGALASQDIKQYFRHLGLYAYRRDFLLEFCSWPVSFLEKQEKLEQLRVLEAGYRIKTVKTEMTAIGIDTMEDVRKAEEYLKNESL